MLVTTVDDHERAVPQVGIYVDIWPDDSYEPSKRSYTTDNEGQTTVLMPAPPRLFRMWTQKAGYVPLFAQWWPERQPDGHLVPLELTFSLPNGTEIGGVIVDDAGNPIEGAVVVVALGNQIDEMGRRPVPSMWLAEVPGPGKNPCLTDAEGRWRLNNVPAGDEVFVRTKVTHPNYISDARWGGMQEEQSVRMDAFRDKSAIIAMHRGVVLSGRVTDPEGQSIPNAVVVCGDDPYGQEGSQEVHTDRDGSYRLQPLNPGKVNVTVVAEHWRPVSRTVDIHASALTEDFELAKGNLLQIQFVDDSGNAVPVVRVGIRGWQGRKSLYNHKHPNVIDTKIPGMSDSSGVFKWEWAPVDNVDYAFYAEGYRTVRRSITADSSVHTVTLSK
jgi:hypothetical protein